MYFTLNERKNQGLLATGSIRIIFLTSKTRDGKKCYGGPLRGGKTGFILYQPHLSKESWEDLNWQWGSRAAVDNRGPSVRNVNKSRGGRREALDGQNGSRRGGRSRGNRFTKTPGS